MNYELLYIIPNQYTEDEAKKIKVRVDELLKTHGAVLGTEEDMGKKKLAYPINQSAHGYYFLNEFELEDGTQLKEINNLLRLDKEILRAQIIIKKKLSAKDLEKLRKREEHRAKIAGIKPEAKPIAKDSAASKSSDHKVDITHLDEKLDEMLKTDDLV